jgi:hypothetical protein
MQFELEMAILKNSFLKHGQGILGVKKLLLWKRV